MKGSHERNEGTTQRYAKLRYKENSPHHDLNYFLLLFVHPPVSGDPLGQMLKDSVPVPAPHYFLGVPLAHWGYEKLKWLPRHLWGNNGLLSLLLYMRLVRSGITSRDLSPALSSCEAGITVCVQNGVELIGSCGDFAVAPAARKCGREGAKTVIRTRHLSPSSHQTATNQCDPSLWAGKCSPITLLDVFPGC